MTKPSTFAPVFQRLIDDPAGALDALRRDPDAFEATLIAEERGRLTADGTIPVHQALGAMLFDANGARIAVDDAPWLPDVARFDDLALPWDAVHRLVAVPGPDGTTLPAVMAPLADVAGWNLTASVRAAAARSGEGRLVLVAGGAAGEGPLDAACRAFGLTELERRVLGAVVRTGSGRRAADRLGIAYSTVREVLPRAIRRTGAANLPAMVRAVVAAAFGVLPGEHDDGTLIADMLPLTERQATIAALIAAGLKREEVADAVGIGRAVVKKELELVYVALGVGTAAELARLVVEVRALRLFARSTDSALGFQDPAVEPTRLTPRADGSGVIAWSDYGPRSGRPVLVVHSNWSCRSVPRPLLAALHARGFRPIAIDRPGFGATALGRSTVADPFSQAIDDALAILDLIGAERMPIVARCGAQFVVALKHAAPERVGRVLLVSPTPQTDDAGLRHGIVGVVKEAFYRSPRLIEFFFRVISAQVSYARTEALTRAIVAGSPIDEALCDDPGFLRDRLRAIRPLSTGNMAGAVHEEQVISHGGYPLPTIDADDWTVIQGDADTHNAAEEVQRYWSRIVPRARFVAVADGGRFMTSSHAALVADALAQPGRRGAA